MIWSCKHLLMATLPCGTSHICRACYSVTSSHTVDSKNTIAHIE
jgi:hypothetical protein